jgi:hypothetical protein
LERVRINPSGPLNLKADFAQDMAHVCFAPLGGIAPLVALREFVYLFSQSCQRKHADPTRISKEAAIAATGEQIGENPTFLGQHLTPTRSAYEDKS